MVIDPCAKYYVSVKSKVSYGPDKKTYVNKRPMGHIAHTEKTVQINKHILLSHKFDKNKRRKKTLLT